jgi:site-specific DNA recombinase
MSTVNEEIKIFNVAIYTRLSREDGDKSESDSISNQKNLIRDYMLKLPNVSIYKEFVDDGYSGVHFDRPAFNHMIEEVKIGNVNCIVVKDLSRFGRNFIEAGKYIERIFPFLGVRFIAINDNYDSILQTS